MADSRNFNFFSTDGNKRRENLRKSLKLIRGGKQSEPTIDSQDLNNDPFLREHYLEGRNKQNEMNWD
jgi:hypothetical protein